MTNFIYFTSTFKNEIEYFCLSIFINFIVAILRGYEASACWNVGKYQSKIEAEDIVRQLNEIVEQNEISVACYIFILEIKMFTIIPCLNIRQINLTTWLWNFVSSYIIIHFTKTIS